MRGGWKDFFRGGSKKSRRDSDLQSLCFCQFCPAVVEGPEAVGFKFQRAGDVQSIERAQAEFWAVLACEIRAKVKGGFWYWQYDPTSGSLVLFQSCMHSLGLRERELSPKNMLA